MSIIYVPPNKNSFWQQIYNGNGLYGLAMSQLVKGFMNGVNKRHEAYIDKQVQDRERQRWQGVNSDIANTGTSEQTTYNPMERMQFQGQTPQERQAFGQGIKNPLKQYGQNELANTVNEGLAGIAGVWNNAEGYGVKNQTVNNPLTAQHLQTVAAKWGLTPDEMQKLSTYYSQYYKNDADFADAQKRVGALQSMPEPQTVNQIGQSSLIAGKDMTNAYNAINPGYSVNSFNNGDVQGIAKTDKRTGETTFDYGQPYGISATKLLEDSTKKYIAQLKESGAWGRHNTPTGTAMFTAKNGNNKPITDAGYNSARKYGMDLVNQLGSNDAIADQMLRQTQDPRRLQAMVDGAYGAEKIAEYGLGMIDNPMHGKAPARLMRAIDPNYLNPQQAKEVAYYRKNYPKETATMSDVDIAKQFNFYNPPVKYAWH